MCAYVHLQGTERYVHLLTVLAAEGLFGGGVLISDTMELLVLAEPRAGGVRLGAERALVSRGGVDVFGPLGGRVSSTSGARTAGTGDTSWRREILGSHRGR